MLIELLTLLTLYSTDTILIQIILKQNMIFAKTKYSSEEVLGCPELVDFGVVILCSLSTPGLGDYGHYEKKDWEWCAIKLGCLYVTEKTSHMRFTKILRG